MDNKKIMSDIIISKKSIRQIPLTKEKKVEYRAEKNKERKPLNSKLVIWFIAGVCLLALFFGLSLLFTSATIVINPRSEKITFTNDTYTAKLNPESQTDLPFEILKIKQKLSETLVATEEKEVSIKATGKIIIYNNYGVLPQRLTNNTRFEATNSKIYRISGSIVVPGLKKVDGKTVPGSIEATVYADQAGPDYNMKLTDLTGDFKIPGFKGDPRYTGFYARLKTDISGGLIGKQSIISDSARKSAETSIKDELKEKLLKELYAIKPENYVILNGGYSLNYTGLADTNLGNNKVQINMEGDLNGIVFNSSKLARYLALKKIPNFDGLPVEFIPTDNLENSFVGLDNPNLGEKGSVLQLKLNGEAVIKWTYDGEGIKKDLLGKSQSDINDTIVKYKNSVSGINILFTPVWTRYLPDNLNKIKILEKSS